MTHWLYAGWYRRRGERWSHFYIGDGVNRSQAACGALTFYNPMYRRNGIYKQTCRKCDAVLAARQRLGVPYFDCAT